jgi:hypothetical protein
MVMMNKSLRYFTKTGLCKTNHEQFNGPGPRSWGRRSGKFSTVFDAMNAAQHSAGM